MAKKAPKVKKKGKKKRKNSATSQRWKKYSIGGGKIKRNAKFCPRCGSGIFLVETKDRMYCGKCHYTEFKNKKEEIPKNQN